jgi:hypothetical protein
VSAHPPFEQKVGRAISPAPLQAVAEATVVELSEALGGEWGAGDVATEPLEAPAVAGGNRDVGVKAEAARACTARRRLGFEILAIVRLDPVSEAQEALASAGPGCDAALQRGGGERGQQGLLLGEGVGFHRVRVRGECAFL